MKQDKRLFYVNLVIQKNPTTPHLLKSIQSFRLQRQPNEHTKELHTPQELRSRIKMYCYCLYAITELLLISNPLTKTCENL